MTDQNELFEPDENLELLLAKIDQLPADSDKAWPKSLLELVDVLLYELKQQGLDDARAMKLAKRLVITQSHYFGGRMHYLPRHDKLNRALRDIEIYKAFNGRNIKELAMQYKLTDMAIYNIIAEQRKLYINRVQPGLF